MGKASGIAGDTSIMGASPAGPDLNPAGITPTPSPTTGGGKAGAVNPADIAGQLTGGQVGQVFNGIGSMVNQAVGDATTTASGTPAATGGMGKAGAIAPPTGMTNDQTIGAQSSFLSGNNPTNDFGGPALGGGFNYPTLPGYNRNPAATQNPLISKGVMPQRPMPAPARPSPLPQRPMPAQPVRGRMPGRGMGRITY